MTGRIVEGEWLIAVDCPRCDRQVEIPALIEAVLKVKHSDAKLSVSCSAKAVVHDCNQLTIDEDQPTLEDDVREVVHDFVRDTAKALGDGTSMTFSHVDRETGEIRDVEIIGGEV